ncbi:hypothetical protein AS180_17955 [Priestia veravalensis]|uniref:HTH cro/C1-type domain-containing protein n=1 Tax=Priestia veravalensis TaxID=1414648 RepID=A0A0V8JHY6_9BACI|nr:MULTISPECIES: helix-turn-helix transcriptional regulator [Priestia]KSU86572.1 hypothetical protein AS180_17955 [Priestia veravalensis]SCC50816.1 Transcriptional regulator, contains XRE-family HTH domain [Priestia flexa]
MSVSPKEFGKELRKLRKEKKLTLTELGKKIDLTQAYLSMIENGRKGIPNSDTIKKLAKGLDIHYTQLMEMAGYEISLIEAFKGVVETPKKVIEVSLPAMGKEETGDGLVAYGQLTDDELRRRLFDLHELLNMDVDLYYKNEFLNDDNRQKIKTMLQTLFE